MSTLKAARADNFYYPPSWSPSKVGYINRETLWNITSSGCKEDNIFQKKKPGKSKKKLKPK